MKERLYYILMNILEKLEQSINVERITDNEIDTLFGSASGTGTDAQDYVIEHGTTTTSDGGTWIYKKWASGIAECWGRKEEIKANYGTFTVGGTWYAYQSEMYYPITFVEPPLITPYPTVGTSFTIPTVVDTVITTSHASIFGASDQGGTKSYVARCYVVGRWK